MKKVNFCAYLNATKTGLLPIEINITDEVGNVVTIRTCINQILCEVTDSFEVIELSFRHDDFSDQ